MKEAKHKLKRIDRVGENYELSRWVPLVKDVAEVSFRHFCKFYSEKWEELVGGCHNRSKKFYKWRISLPPEFHAMLLLSSSSFVLSPLSLFYFPLFRLPPTPPTACSQWPTGRELCPLHPEASFKFQQCQWVELRDLGQLGGWDHHDQRPSAVELDPHPEGRRG